MSQGTSRPGATSSKSKPRSGSASAVPRSPRAHGERWLTRCVCEAGEAGFRGSRNGASRRRSTPAPGDIRSSAMTGARRRRDVKYTLVAGRSSIPSTTPSAGLMPDPFSYPRYTIKFSSTFGRRFVFAPDGRMIMYVKQPVFRLREEFKIWADEGESQALLTIKSRQVVAINFAYDVIDARTNEWLGAVQKRGLKSRVRDTFELIDPQGQVIGKVEEKGASVVRRFIPLLTSKHDIELGGEVVTQIRQVFRFFIKEFTVDLTMGVGRIDPRFAMACA